MGLESTVIDESSATHITEIRTVSGMQHHVHFQGVLIGETFITNNTQVLLLLFMDSLLVTLQVGGSQVGFLTNITFIRAHSFVLQHVELEAMMEVETLLALVTLVGL